MEKDNTYRKLEKDFAAIRDERGTQANTANRIGSAFLSLLSYIGSAAFLRKDVPDTAEQVITFLKGIVAKAVSFFQGIVNKGDINNDGDITNTGNISNAGDITNSGNIMTNNLTVTGKATFFELEIQKAKAAGGMSVNSAGTFHIDAVEETEYEFVCYQRAEKDGVMLLQRCEPKDQMMCSNGMNILKGGKGNHYYWRLATEAPKKVVMHTIDGKEEKCLKLVLSKTDRHRRKDESPQDIGDIPKVGDDLVQIGNRDNKERQSVMMTCAYNSFDPELKPSYWAHYMGVNDYDISKHRYTWFAANGSQVTGNFKVQSDNGELESIEDYMKGLASKNSAVLYKLVMSSSQFNVKADGSFSPEFISIYAYKVQGENLTQLSPSESVKVVVTKGEKNLPLSDKSHVAVISGKWNLWADKEDMNDVFNVDLIIKDKLADRQKLVDMQKIHIVRDGKNGQDGKDGLDGKDGINGEKGTDGKDGSDAVSYKLLPLSENALAYITEGKEKKVDVMLVYKIQKSVGEQVNFTTLIVEGMTLTLQPSVGVPFKYNSGMYGLSGSMDYDKMTDNSYIVTLTKGGNIVDQRIVPITFKPKLVFDIDAENGKLTSRIETVEGDVNEFQTTINETKSTVGNLSKDFTQIKQTSKEINFTVNNGTRPNLLWGSDLDLSEVQDKIQIAYAQGAVIQQNTAKKENLQRQLDATPTYDTAKRNNLQKQINACDDAITAARNKVSECKAAIQKHLGVVISGDMEIGNREMFQYLKGEGVGGSDAISFKNAYKREDWAKWTNISWHDVTLKPHTQYTISVWVKFKSYGLKGSMYVDCASDDGRYCFGGYLYKEHYYDRADIDKWTRVKYVFDSGESKKMSSLFFACIAEEEEGAQCEIWLCRPKLEESNKATPWCAYDGTVDALEQTGIFIKDKKIRLNARNTEVSGDLSVGSLRTRPKLVGDPFIEAHDGEFNIFTFERKKGIELSVDDSGMPHLIFYDKDGNPTYDLGWTGMKQLTDAVVQEYWSADFLMMEDTNTNATAVSNITDAMCTRYYTYHAAYNRKTGIYGSNEEYNGVAFKHENIGSQRIADGWYYPVNNGSLARVADESVYIYGTRKYQYSNGKMIGYENVYIEKDPVTGAWTFSDYKGGGGVHHSDHSQI
ncbi:MAG: hypothetical protein SPJ90_05340 [Prevotella sp.]|nr:hypothetical protein [Prevotellaceae bacterium]MDY5843836.1 hypothetical protein [Prevotella sp.]